MLKFILVCCTLYVSVVDSARILGIFMTPSYSHQVVFQPIWKELSLQGHEVVVVTPNPLRDPTLTNLTEIDVSEICHQIFKNTSSIATLCTTHHGTFAELNKLMEIYMTLSEVLLSSEVLQKFIDNKAGEHFDLFLVEYLWPTMYPFKDVFKCPMVGILSLPMNSVTYSHLGMPHNPILNPEIILPFSRELTFKERLTSTLFDMLFKFANKFVTNQKIQELVNNYFGENTRNIQEISSEVSLVLVNENLALQNVKPIVPGYVPISGIHIKAKKPLPSDLKKFLDDAKEGAIYFSLGTNVKPHLLSEERLLELMDAFAELPYKILWKYDTVDFNNVPKNVEIRGWLPQQDILGHPNVKLFITQGGLQSLDESINNTVPVLVMPFFGDQRYNADRITKIGGGLELDFHTFRKEEVIEKVTTLIKDPRYKNRMAELALIASDQPMSALEKSIWHINYVLRHKGAPHLRYDAINIPWYQLKMLDVYAVIFTILALVLYTLYRILNRMLIGLKMLNVQFYSKEKQKIQ